MTPSSGLVANGKSEANRSASGSSPLGGNPPVQLELSEKCELELTETCSAWWEREERGEQIRLRLLTPGVEV